ncbi:hypothetical protein QFC19_006190 [Naganishia cerealis]|uniref:Uncharacterized protein n=1 Tax=Naganishia cerealis TaxID=610337 RepID=A0ACC2VK34_9TREE|nr:hypothetical protein QFC19_006190 [Naganishia cerealis]
MSSFVVANDTAAENTKFVVRYDPTVAPETGSADEFKLLEISAELAKAIEQADKDGEEAVTLTMKGTPSDDAVICTSSQTFSLRTITVSNSMLFLRPSTTDTNSPDEETQQNLLIQDTCHEILELTPTVPRLDRIEKVLKETSWSGMKGFNGARGIKRAHDDEGEESGQAQVRALPGSLCQQTYLPNTSLSHPCYIPFSNIQKQIKRYTRAQLQSLIQASDRELDAGLKQRNVIEIDGTFPPLPDPQLRPSILITTPSREFSPGHLIHLPTRHLLPLISTLLSLLTIHSINPHTLPSSLRRSETLDDRYADGAGISADLSKDFAVDQDVSRGVMGVFGDLVGPEETYDKVIWKADLPRLVKEIGKGLLSLESALDPPTMDDFVARWKEQVGPDYEHLLDLQLLEGEYLIKHPHSASMQRTPLVVPFSVSSLPNDPAQRFTDLFLTRSQWRPEDMQPFLKGLTPEGDRKAMDKLVVKYVRVVKDSGKNGSSVWWHARR